MKRPTTLRRHSSTRTTHRRLPRAASRPRKAMKVWFIASEVEPFAKTGGLADVLGALPRALAALGHDVRIVLPLYAQVDRARYAVTPTDWRVTASISSRTLEGRVWESTLPMSRVRVFFIEQETFFHRAGLYQENDHDYPDNLERFSFFSQAALQVLPLMRWRPDVIHCHDWQAALACAHLAFGVASRDPFFSSTATLLTIHNLAYQGLFPRSQWRLTQLPESAFSVRGLEFYGQINCLKGGLVSAQLLTTVSPTYAQEIQTPEFGCGLEGVLKERRQDVVGILNGIDEREWDPSTDPHLAARYSAGRFDGKLACKRILQRRLRLPERPGLLIGMVQRLVDQKGIDLFVHAAERLMALPVQIAMLGTGQHHYHRQLEALASRFPDRLSVTLTFDNALAHQIEAGADAFLMPSRFEPCGLNQMYSMRYGTVPIVRRIGGLADTVTDVGSLASPIVGATGFVFDDHTVEALIGAVGRAVTAFDRRPLWRRLMFAGMRQDFSWSHSARAYVRAYERARSAQHSSVLSARAA